MAAKDEFEGGLVPVAEPEPAFVAENKAAAEAEDTRDVSEATTADAIKALRAELDAVRGELQTVATTATNDQHLLDQNASKGGMPWMYWRFPASWPDKSRAGWVIAAPGGRTPSGARDGGAYAVYTRKRMEPLDKYGIIDTPHTEQGWLDYIPLLQRGGAAEIPLSQILAWQWHRRPPIRGFKFAQYDTAVAADAVMVMTCEACGTQLFFEKENREAGGAYRAHLMKAHQYPFREAAEAVKKAGIDLSPFFQEVAAATA